MRETPPPENIVLATGIIAEAIRRIKSNQLDCNALKSEHPIIRGMAATGESHEGKTEGREKWTKELFKRTGR